MLRITDTADKVLRRTMEQDGTDAVGLRLTRSTAALEVPVPARLDLDFVLAPLSRDRFVASPSGIRLYYEPRMDEFLEHRVLDERSDDSSGTALVLRRERRGAP